MKEFTHLLDSLIAGPPYNGSQHSFASATGVNETHLSRLLNGKREFSPRIVGLIARRLPEADAQELVKCYLREIAEEVADHERRRPITIK